MNIIILVKKLVQNNFQKRNPLNFTVNPHFTVWLVIFKVWNEHFIQTNEQKNEIRKNKKSMIHGYTSFPSSR